MAEKAPDKPVEDAPSPAPKAQVEPLRVMSRADYAVQVREHLMAQPQTYLVLRGDEVVGEFETEADAAAYVQEAG